jgi:hypothetical protein
VTPPLSPGQRWLAREVVLRHGANSELLDALERDQLTDAERRALGDLATEDLAARGFDADYAPTTVGKRLEELIDALNGPF